MMRPRVLIADDHRVVAQGLKSMLSAEFELVGVVADGQAMIDAAKTLHPDVIVADVSMPVRNGIDALEALRREDIDVPVVFLTMHNQPGYARRALSAGAAGYVLKLAAPEELVQAIRAALDGGTFVSPALARAVFETTEDGPADAGERIAALTSHQREILRMLADGLSAKEIAKKLDISSRTVESHKYQIMDALGAQSSAELIRLAIRHGLVEP
ncbi:MAG: response regulator transcription factor [Burkholderiales bacterium]|nr:response regulator transcription factor [Burkholderiales bacterium]